MTGVTWKSGIATARESLRVPSAKPHWDEGSSATIPEEKNTEIQHYSTISKKSGVFLISGKGEDTAEVKIDIHLVDPDGDLTYLLTTTKTTSGVTSVV